MQSILSFLLLVGVTACIGEYIEHNTDHYTSQFAVEIDGDDTIADLVAGVHGLRLVRNLAGLGNVYLFNHPSMAKRSKRSATDLLQKLESDPNVKRVEQQKLLKRVKRVIVHDKQLELPIRHYEDKSIYDRHYPHHDGVVSRDQIPGDMNDINPMGFTDTFWNDMWYLNNVGQTGGPPGYDVNVIGAWQKGITGKGVTVCILDDGIEYTHPDLKDNYDPDASTDLNSDASDTDPMPNESNPDNSHGTRCAGEVAAAANNSICAVGIAYEANIGGVRLLDGPITDSLEAEALTFNNHHIDIYSASWGPPDDGKTLEGPKTFAKEALVKGVTEGRDGLGSIFVWATGNGGQANDDCNCDGYTSSIYTLSIGCISDEGLSTYFSEVCPSTMAVIYTGGSHAEPGEKEYRSPKLKVVTTDIHQDCTLNFQGTSSAAPLAAGCFALVLQANPKLTWRDMQHLVIEAARIPNSQEPDWTINGAGKHVNNRFGFGAIDCGKMVEMAEDWKTVAEQQNCDTEVDNVEQALGSQEVINRTLEFNGCAGKSRIDKLEHVQVHIDMEHSRRGDINLIITSPCGTSSEILSIRPKDDFDGSLKFTFMTVHNWGENPVGPWTLSIMDRPPGDSNRQNKGIIHSWSMTLYGTTATPGEKTPPCSSATIKKETGNSIEEAHIASNKEIKHIIASEEAESETLHINEKSKEPQSETSKQNEINPLNSKFKTKSLYMDDTEDTLTDMVSDLADIFEQELSNKRTLDRNQVKEYLSTKQNKPYSQQNKLHSARRNFQENSHDLGDRNKQKERKLDSLKAEDVDLLLRYIEEYLEDNAE